MLASIAHAKSPLNSEATKFGKASTKLLGGQHKNTKNTKIYAQKGRHRGRRESEREKKGASDYGGGLWRGKLTGGVRDVREEGEEAEERKGEGFHRPQLQQRVVAGGTRSRVWVGGQ